MARAGDHGRTALNAAGVLREGGHRPVGLDPGLGAPDDVPQEPGCFNILPCQQQADGACTWSVLSVNQVPRERVKRN
jgi:hypothetical protein